LVAPLWNQKLKCPFCAGDFETTRMRASTIKVLSKESDFQNIYEGECPYYYAITVCPHCTFAAQNKDFEKIRAAAEPKIMEASKRMKQSTVKKPDIFELGSSNPKVAIMRHELALAFFKMRAYKDLGIRANLYLHLVWLNRMAGDTEREKAAMTDAITAYQEFYQQGYKLPEHLGEPGILYLIGELHRRQGLYKEARHWFEQGLASKEIRSFPRIAEMIRDMMLTTKEQMG
jgi:uncharacterized protein (DUF2225 family)